MFHSLIGLVVYQLIIQFVNADSLANCRSGLDQTLYANDLLNQIKLNAELGLPQRYVLGIQMKSGGIFNLTTPVLIDSPVKVVCANQSLGALQIKFAIADVILAYSWSFNDDKCKGIAKTRPQDIFVDLNLEKNEKLKKVRLMSSYISALTQTDFDVRFKDCIYSNLRLIEKQVKAISKKTALHDVDAVLQREIKSFTNDFIDRNELFLY